MNLFTVDLRQGMHNELINFGKQQQMASSTYHASQTRNAGNAAGRRDAFAGEGDMSVFSLRDTLSSIVVREANFSEFLMALKQCGLHTARQ